ncbi:zinc protease [Bryocella elongata]|uniref:Zinc protease n=1 Tax=Bryocella elongata TaxID=863522 RepID=A0A1H5XR93_9BACT|nr:pitrilysin family protein [Bryocella elongata]SEG14238.1 zinc protease [Bryocella elongata]
MKQLTRTVLSAAMAAAVCATTPAMLPAFAAAPAEAKLKLPEIKYETYTLPNGLKVITHEDHRLPLVSVDLWYHVGPLNEKPGRTGFAHLFEHMMFEGSEHVGEKAHIKFVQGAGATDVNGTTDFDRTNYFETMPANQLELALWLESDRMGFLMEGLDRVKLANQRDVVRNERRQGEGRPYDVADEEMYHLLFPKGHPYYGSVIGSHADIEAARIADIRDFHQQFYTPNNASIAIAGDFDPKQLKALLEQYFGSIPQGPAVEPVNVQTPAISTQKRSTITDTVKLPRLSIGWLTPAAFTPDAYATDSAMYALGMSKTSRLDEALVLKTQVAQSVNCESQQLKLTGIASCDITAKPGVKLEDLEATFWAELKKLQDEGPTPGEVEAAKATSLTRKITGLQRLGGFGGVADTLDMYNQYTGDPGYLPKDVAAAAAVTPEAAKAAANKYLTKDSAVVIYCVPGKKVLDDVPRSPDNTDADVKITNPYTQAFEDTENWRKAVPKPGPAPTVHLPVPQSFALANGMKVLVYEQHSLPILTANVVVRAGGENNPAGKEGLSMLTTQVMGEATETRSVEQLSGAAERIGTRVGLSATMDMGGADMTVLTNHTSEGMDLLSDVVEHPAFHQEDFDRLRKRRLVGIQQETDSVAGMAQRVGPMLIYGRTPYGVPFGGTTASMESITRDDAVSFYKSRYAPGDAALVLVGDISLKEARTLAEQYFGKWTGTAAAIAPLPVPPTPSATHIVIIDKPGAPQTALFAFGVGVPATSPDLPTIQVMNYTLGGAFASRINMNLREEHGYTYGASSGFRMYRGAGPFLAGGLVRTNVTGDSAVQLMYELKRFPDNPPTEAELTEAKNSNVQSLPGVFDTTASIAGSLSSIFLYSRPLDYYATLPARYRAVTAADVARVAREYVHPDQLTIVAAGDRSKIEPGLKDAKLGPIEVRDINGKKVE